MLTICACSSVDRAVASDAMCAGSTPVRRTTSGVRSTPIRVVARRGAPAGTSRGRSQARLLYVGMEVCFRELHIN